MPKESRHKPSVSQMSYTSSMPDREKMLSQTYRLPSGVVDFIEKLVAKQMLGQNKSAVVRHLLERSIREIIDTEFVRKHEDTMQILSSDNARK